MKKTFALLSAVALALGVASTAADAVTLRMATDVSRQDTQGQGGEYLAKLVDEASKGDMEIKFYPDGTLGTSTAIVSGVRTGTIDMAIIGCVNLGGLAEGFLALDLPFIFKDKAHVYRSLDGKVGEALNAQLDKVGLVCLAYFENGFRNITNSRKPIREPADVAGLKIRVPQSNTLVATFEALGANPVPMAFGELYTAMETGAIDSQDHPMPALFSGKFYEVQKYLSMTRHGYAAVAVVVNKRKFDKLSAEEQAILRDAAQKAAVYQRELNDKMENEMVAEMEKSGLQVNDDVNLDAFVEATKSVRDNFTKEHSDEIVKLIEAERNVQ